MSEEIKYISKDSKSNKLWSYQIIDNTTVIYRYGRIGGHITEMEESFSSNSTMMSKIYKKVAEKTADKPGKRYQKVTEEEVQSEKEEAQNIGIRNKIVFTKYVEKENNKLIEIPKYDPDHYVLIRIMDSWSKEHEDILLSKNESLVLVDLNDKSLHFKNTIAESSYHGKMSLHGVRQYLRGLINKIKKVLNVTMAALGNRQLDLGDEDDFKSAIDDSFMKEMGDVNRDLVISLASMVVRELDF